VHIGSRLVAAARIRSLEVAIMERKMAIEQYAGPTQRSAALAATRKGAGGLQNEGKKGKLLITKH
jgi:hypothetical protein